MDIVYWLPIVFFIIALFYSMVGFGGGSSYIAVMVLAAVPYQQIPPTALVCNLIVSSSAFWHFYKGGHFRFKIVFPFVLGSIPMAYVGANVIITKEVFSLILGVALFIVGIRLVFSKVSQQVVNLSWKKVWGIGLSIGILLGFLAGLVGIGGGIFLSPILLILGWANMKEASAAASFFILVNSFSGLLGQFQKGFIDLKYFLPMALAVLIAGQFGSRMGAYRLPKIYMQRVLAVLVLYVSIRLLS